MHKIYTSIGSCRLCNGEELHEHVNLGVQPLSGTFPMPGEEVASGPLRLVECQECGLVQLGENYDPAYLYGDNYGYRSGLNQSMVRHLGDVAHYCERTANLQPGDLVLDIGSNDGTLLGQYETPDIVRTGIDPTAAKFAPYHPPQIHQIYCDFFSAGRVQSFLSGRKARIVTSIACFYDLQRPMEFVRDILAVLADDGIWVTEQTYLPATIEANAFDTICHEHLEYYALSQFFGIARATGLAIIDVEENDTNGGSFLVTLARATAPYCANTAKVEEMLKQEGLFYKTRTFDAWAAQLPALRDKIIGLLTDLKAAEKTVLGYGASTKGNVLLTYCGITADLLPAIAEINEEKFGHVTPGSNIAIVPEKAAHAMDPDYFFVLPWHFREETIRREQEFLARGGKLIFPLPKLEVVE